MKSRFLTLLPLASALLVGAPQASAQAVAGQAVGLITITNLTKGQNIAPVVVATHSWSAEPLFVPGLPASAELAELAEEGRGGSLTAKLMADPAVLDVTTVTGTGGPIMPGETASAEIIFDYQHNLVSLAGKLETTNDGFMALRDTAIPVNAPPQVDHAKAWDAGSEANTESCEHIPGPPCGNHDVRVEDHAEGYVYIHKGITGVGHNKAGHDDHADHGAGNHAHEHATGATSTDHDWRNPVAQITISGLSPGSMRNR